MSLSEDGKAFLTRYNSWSTAEMQELHDTYIAYAAKCKLMGSANADWAQKNAKMVAAAIEERARVDAQKSRAA